MKKRISFSALVLVMALSLILTVSVSAHNSMGTFELDCTDVHFTGTVAEGETLRLYVRLHDTSDWQSPRVQDDIILISSPGPFDVTVPWVADPGGKLHMVAITATMDGVVQQLALDEGVLDCPPPAAEVCSPGFWKNHPDAWVGYSPTDDFDTTFEVDYFDPDITLLEALKAKGGGVNKLARVGTAALLNATALNYPLIEAEVKAAIQAGDVALLESFAENCPID